MEKSASTHTQRYGTDAVSLTSEDGGKEENCIWLQSCLLMD